MKGGTAADLSSCNSRWGKVKSQVWQKEPLEIIYSILPAQAGSPKNSSPGGAVLRLLLNNSWDGDSSASLANLCHPQRKCFIMPQKQFLQISPCTPELLNYCNYFHCKHSKVAIISSSKTSQTPSLGFHRYDMLGSLYKICLSSHKVFF